MICLFAAAIELFCDWTPPGTPVEQIIPQYNETLAYLKTQGWDDVTAFCQNVDNTWVFWNLGPKVKEVDFASRPKEKMILFAWEPHVVQPELYDPKVQAQFGKVYTWDDDLVDNERFFKFHYPVLSNRIDVFVPFEKKKLCTMIATRFKSKDPGSLYGERELAALFFDKKKGEFDLYGNGWSQKKYKNSKGRIEKKLEVLAGYKYAICYENTSVKRGYVSEKIFDCFAAGVVPVYWGAPNVTDYVPAECFIDRRNFKNNEELYQFLKKITKEEYAQYLSAAEKFLKSEKAQLFSQKKFIEDFKKALAPN
jgi:hypothetical protein